MQIKDFFNRRYQQNKNIFGEKPIDLVVKAAKLLPKGGNVLELGAGEGRNSLYLARRGYQVTAIDAAPTAISRLQSLAKSENLKLKALVADVAKYQFREKFNLIVATGLFHFLPPHIGNNLIAHMKRATKNGGLNAVAALASDHPRRQMPHIYKNRELEKLYHDWKIIIYEEAAGHFHGMANSSGQPPKVAKLLAQNMGN